ncbi:hypothetical protein RCU53_24660, partial [Escherichia coli]|nr:hypothetical protein [Escherichia coli]
FGYEKKKYQLSLLFFTSKIYLLKFCLLHLSKYNFDCCDRKAFIVYTIIAILAPIYFPWALF